jgi:hypothetical protein
MNKSHATIFLTRYIGESDGEWTKDEMMIAIKSGHLHAALEEASDWADKITSGELNFNSAIYILNQESRDVQLNCLVTCLMTALADGHLDSAESQALAEITVSLNQNITPTDVVEAIKLRLS